MKLKKTSLNQRMKQKTSLNQRMKQKTSLNQRMKQKTSLNQRMKQRTKKTSIIKTYQNWIAILQEPDLQSFNCLYTDLFSPGDLCFFLFGRYPIILCCSKIKI